jgi:hypothetical protein
MPIVDRELLALTLVGISAADVTARFFLAGIAFLRLE